jgi:hypothetical protein
MYKIRLKVASGLLVLACLMTSLAFSQPPETKPTQESPKPLSSDDFIKKVTALDAETQSKLDAAITKLLGTSQPAGAAPSMPPPTTSGGTSSETQTPSSSPDYTTPTTTASPTSSGGGLNLLQ